MNTPILVGTGFVLFSLYFLRFALANYKRALASVSWPSVQGRVTEVALWGKRRIGSEMKDAMQLAMKYDYRVGETEHEGSKIAFYTLVYPETLNFANEHPEGSEITVFYDATNPSQSVLLNGPPESKRYSEIVIACLGIAIGLIVILMNSRGILW